MLTMSEISLDRKISKKCNETIVVSGSARSGTTILAKIIHSFKDVELLIEPPMLFSMFATISSIDEKYWRLLYETYLYEEFLINALSGRSINCNYLDDSSIYKVKSQELIEKRLNRSLRKTEAENMVQKCTIAYKMPDIVPFLPKLQDYYPGTKFIIMLREAPDVFNSLLEKKWFSDKSLNEENLIWPSYFVNQKRVPSWVNINDREEWIEMDELHRIAYYYIRVSEPVERLSGSIRVKYSELVKHPETTVKRVAEKLTLVWGEKTDEIIRTIKRRRKDVDRNIINKLKSPLREQVEYYSSIS